MMRPHRDRQPAANGERRYGADRRLFLPAVVIAVLYGSLWLAALATGRGGTALAQALLLVVVAAVPVLLVRAWLRYRALELRVAGNGVRYTKGLLRPEWQQLPAARITDARTVYGAAGRRFGAGALILTLDDGSRVRIADVANIEDAAARVRAGLAAARQSGDA